MNLVKEKSLNGNDSALPQLDEKEVQEIVDTFTLAFSDAIIKARRKKYSDEAHRAYFKKIEEQSKSPTTAEEMLNLVVQKYGPALANREKWDNQFYIPEQLKDLYWKLALYFSGDIRMEEYNLSQKKGILIFGDVGCGKTSALKSFERNPIQSFRTIMCSKVVGEYQEAGNEVIERYSDNHSNEYKSEYFGHNVLGFAFDDLGTETLGNYYKTTLEVMAELIMRRYDNASTRGNMTHITTNIVPEDIEKRYGLRVYDRMKSMFNVITLPTDAKSLRN